jgi:beta-N-acetylhexosaminidase
MDGPMTRRTPVLVALLALLLALPLTGAGAQTLAPEPSATSEASPVPIGTNATDRVGEIMAGMSRRQKVGQLFMSRIYGYRAKEPAPGAVRSNEAHLGVADARELFQRFPVGSVVYFAHAGNLQHPEQVARLSNGIQRAALEAGTVPVLISTDQEHGVIERLGPPAARFPGSMALAATRDRDLARAAARVTGADLRAVGIHQDLAPVADVNNDPANPVIGVRSFGSRPGLVSSMTAAQVRGFQDDAQVAATVKHFPGHGDTSIDSHVGLPTIDHSTATWWELDAPPFEAAIEAGVDVVMTAHVRVPSLDPSGRPATLSRPILTGILRERMGYDGVVMTDSLAMAAIRDRYGDDRAPVLALKAGADIVADPPDLPVAFRGVLTAVENGEISQERLDRSVERVLRLKERLGLLDEALVDVDAVEAELGTPADLEVARAVGDAAVTVLRDRRSWLPIKSGWDVALAGVRPEGAGALERTLQEAGRSLTTGWTGSDPGSTGISKALGLARAADLTVVMTKHLGSFPRQRTLVARLLDSGQRVVVVYAGSPYEASWFTSAPAQIATYSDVPVSMRGLARVITGQFPATGKLPVRIPKPGGGTLYPFGHGLAR